MDVFYKVKKSKTFFRDIINHSIEIDVDELNCSISWARTKSTKPLCYLFENWNKVGSCVFIEREPIGKREEKYIEAGFTVEEQNRTYFLFCYLNHSELAYFLEKYQLKIK